MGPAAYLEPFRWMNPAPSTSPGKPAPRFTFRPDVEGLRAIAVLLVLAYHAKFGFTGGFIGVDVFFVVSGFLITSLLLADADAGELSLRTFWARRVRRLLPPAALLVAVTALASWFVLEPSRLAGLAGDVIASATFSANVRFTATNGDYLSGLTLPSPLLHFWSLALEEQFYVIWPALVALAARTRKTGCVLAFTVAVLMIASLVWSWHVTPLRPAAAYFLLPSRAWELLAGAALALVWSRVERLDSRLRAVGGWFGLVALVALAWRFDSETVFPGLAALLPVVATLLVLTSGPTVGPAAVLGWRPLQWIGKRSYALYLWHWPLLVLFETRFGALDAYSRAGVLALSVLCAELSLRLVEDPARHNAWLSAVPRRSLLAGVSVSVLIVGLGLGVRFAAPSDASTLTAVATAAPSVVTSEPASDSDAEGVAVTPSSIASPATTVAPAPLGQVLLIGDSTLAPLRWFEGADVALQGFDWTLDAESCRRLLLRSCRGRESRTPASAAPVIDELREQGQRYDTIVVMGGYHSTPETIGKEFDGLVESVRRHGASRLVLLNFRESLAFPVPGSRGKESIYGVFNDVVSERLATGNYPEVNVLDWNAFSATANSWFRSDGIHTNLAGTLGLGSFISESLATIGGLPCGERALCDGPSAPLPADELLIRFGLEDTDRHCYEMGTRRTPKCKRDKLA